ncbi:hypothetical protein GF366_00115, partial [Candidatus Peregrinibacteria bacterium]|nr:hypothetical protein [Candidatus Peregrinibacteria bacterium]
MRKLLNFLVYSNLYLAFGAGIVALATAFLLGKPMNWIYVFIPFSASFLIYNYNRTTDSKEDMVNVPERTIFVERFGKKILTVAFFLYIISIGLALQRNIYTLLITLIPVFCAFMYSYSRLKRFFMVKNLMVSVSWGFSVLLVAAFFEFLDPILWLVYVFFFLQFLINVVIFDIKDIRGDYLYKIKTLPAGFGIKNTKKFCFLILFVLLM